MKLCCSSRSHSRLLGTGELTQLEWIDLCAHAWMLDGVDLYATHFPRTDDDYLAQIKKLCVDRCLTIAALGSGVQFGEEHVDEQIEEVKRWTDVAFALGAPLVHFACGAVRGSPGVAWRELIRGLKYVCVHAKARNVTLALRPAQLSLVASPADVKRALKECDSAWLRLALPTPLFASPQSAEWTELLEDAVFVPATATRLDTFGADETIDYLAVLTLLGQRAYRGFVSLEYAGAESEPSAVPRAVAWLREMLSRSVVRAVADFPEY